MKPRFLKILSLFIIIPILSGLFIPVLAAENITPEIITVSGFEITDSVGKGVVYYTAPETNTVNLYLESDAFIFIPNSTQISMTNSEINLITENNLGNSLNVSFDATAGEIYTLTFYVTSQYEGVAYVKCSDGINEAVLSDIPYIIENEYLGENATVIAYDKEGNTISGCIFSIGDKIAATDDYGIAVFSNLKLKEEYTVVLTSVPEGYIIDETENSETFTVEALGQNPLIEINGASKLEEIEVSQEPTVEPQEDVSPEPTEIPEEKYNLNILVCDSDGNPVAGADISAGESIGVTDDFGYCTFSLENGKEFEIKISKESYVEYVTSVILVENTGLTVILDKIDISTPEPSEAPSPESTIDSTEELTPEPTVEPTIEPTVEPIIEVIPETSTEPEITEPDYVLVSVYVVDDYYNPVKAKVMVNNGTGYNTDKEGYVEINDFINSETYTLGIEADGYTADAITIIAYDSEIVYIHCKANIVTTPTPEPTAIPTSQPVVTPVPTSVPIAPPVIDNGESDDYIWTEPTSEPTPEVTADPFKDISVEVKWLGDEENREKRPESVVIQLKMDDIVYDSQNVNKENEWTVSWEYLNPNRVWTVASSKVEGYKKECKTNENKVIITYSYDSASVIADPIPESEDRIYIKVKAKWIDDNNKNGKRPERITVSLKKDGEIYSSKVMNSDNDWLVSWNEPDKSNKWSVSTAGTPSGYEKKSEMKAEYVELSYTYIGLPVVSENQVTPVPEENLVSTNNLSPTMTSVPDSTHENKIEEMTEENEELLPTEPPKAIITPLLEPEAEIVDKELSISDLINEKIENGNRTSIFPIIGCGLIIIVMIVLCVVYIIVIIKKRGKR